MDTEGLGSTQRTASCDLQIFSFCILLSSLFIYNSMGAIDEQAIDDLHLVLHITKHIHAGSRKGSEAGLAQYLPSFLWVLRDFHLRLVNDDGGSMNEKEYLEYALRPLPGQEDKNKLRGIIKELFYDRDCVTLVRPAADEEALKSLHRVPYESLRPEFRMQADAFVRKVYDNVKPKSIDGSYISGAMLAELASEYCNCINSGAVPVIRSAWSSVVQHQIRKSMRDALHLYQAQMAEIAEDLPMSENQLHDLYKAAKEKAANLFLAPRFDETDQKFQESRAELANRFKQVYEQLREDNARASRNQCERVAAELYASQIEGKLKTRGAYHNVQELMHDWERLRAEYAVRASGPAQAEVLNTWIYQRMTESTNILSSDLNSDANERIGVLQQRLSEVEERIKQRDAETHSERLAQNVPAFLSEQRALQQRVDHLQQGLSEIEHRTNETLQQRVDTLQQGLSEMELRAKQREFGGFVRSEPPAERECLGLNAEVLPVRPSARPFEGRDVPAEYADECIDLDDFEEASFGGGEAEPSFHMMTGRQRDAGFHAESASRGLTEWLAAPPSFAEHVRRYYDNTPFPLQEHAQPQQYRSRNPPPPPFPAARPPPRLPHAAMPAMPLSARSAPQGLPLRPAMALQPALWPPQAPVQSSPYGLSPLQLLATPRTANRSTSRGPNAQMPLSARSAPQGLASMPGVPMLAEVVNNFASDVQELIWGKPQFSGVGRGGGSGSGGLGLAFPVARYGGA
jgi:AraC-like DNA-binding protein